ncbi:16S rRNA (uracil(1498)-N(3))-methyltransferase [Gilvimarinus polysaccharolyticus]|uniref:16S rRNA (uracil(1498)-N(3))-methyltransferase n=1 Tax=Gilvimarinus polysaccharolyticus TaxID=863921 RepID=UPI0006733920|nr:16S rRNA (uracil(1498)-N(3))-methyltransferase [Gilvimarinus polysaccharolyticus]
MNLILLFADDFDSHGFAVLRDPRRIEHICQVHRAKLGDTLRVGQVDGLMGNGKIVQLQSQQITLELNLTEPPPPPSNIHLILALPRPPMLKRTLQTIATLGVKQLTLLQSARVEKSYWQSPQLQPQKIHSELLLGLEQGCDTQFPVIHTAKRFRPFVEDQLPELIRDHDAILAHPYVDAPCPTTTSRPTLLAIGPEGGFIDNEINMLTKAGFKGVTLGRRIMRVETVVPYLLGHLGG